MHAARRRAAAEQVLRVTIDVEGNLMVSAALFGKVSVLCGMYS